MRLVRAVATAVILLDLALLAVTVPLRQTTRRYSAAAMRRELRDLSLENRILLHRVAVAKRPDEVARRAAAMGIDVAAVESAWVDGAAERTASSREAVARASRR